MYRLVEPIHTISYFAEEPTELLMGLGLRNYWDGYFAGRAAPLGRVPAEVVHADPGDWEAWLEEMLAATERLVGGSGVE